MCYAILKTLVLNYDAILLDICRLFQTSKTVYQSLRYTVYVQKLRWAKYSLVLTLLSEILQVIKFIFALGFTRGRPFLDIFAHKMP
jgi:hypothetical protein